MPELHLIIGNKRYSSWSLRPWLALAQNGIPFEPFKEIVIPLYRPESKAAILRHSPSGKVPAMQRWVDAAHMEPWVLTF